MRWVVDAAVAVEILLRTAAGEQAWATVETGEVLAPDLLDSEVLAALRHETLSGRLAVGRAEEALEDLAAWDIERVPSFLLLEDAWAHCHDVSAHDALYVAAARRHQAILLTADGPLARAPALGVPVHDIRIPAGAALPPRTR